MSSSCCGICPGGCGYTVWECGNSCGANLIERMRAYSRSRTGTTTDRRSARRNSSRLEYVRHAWPGAWVNSLFRNESDVRASDMIRSAVALTRARWEPPRLGIVSFVDPKHVKPTRRRGASVYGYCYLMAGWKHVGFTKGGLWTWQQLPHEMPEPDQSLIAPLFQVNHQE